MAAQISAAVVSPPLPCAAPPAQQRRHVVSPPLPCAAPPAQQRRRLLRHGGAVNNEQAAPLTSIRLVASSRSTKTPRGFVVVAVAGDSGVEVEAVPRSVPVRVAYELQQAGHRYLDVRTEGEFSAGHPEGAVNIPYMHKTGSGMIKNTQFLEQVSTIFGKDDEIIVGCQSGKRSLTAATELCSAGFTAVTDIAGGFSSWRENGLPVNR